MRQTAAHHLSLLALSAALACGTASVASAQARTYTIGNGSRIQFVSDAPLETITGVSSRVSGSVSFDASNLSSASGTITVPVASIRTGMDLRDEHLRSDNWLDAQRHPNATFEITGVEGASSIPNNQLTRLRLRGRFTIHGRTHDVVASARVRIAPNGQLRGQASFSVQLTDYDVSVPLPVRLKVSNTIRVNVSIRATPS